MSDAAKNIRRSAQLGRAAGPRSGRWRLFPDAVTAAAERGLRPLGKPPAGIPPTAHPAPVFDPTRFEHEQ